MDVKPVTDFSFKDGLCTIRVDCFVAKRLLNYKGKCGRLHGTTHIIEVSFSGGDDVMVADHYDLHARLREWINENWDHTVILNRKDNPLGKAISELTGQKIYYLPLDPTIEQMAAYLKHNICPELFKDVLCEKVRVYDSPDAWAEV